tara:strand:- start:192 stop:479 length:288 start_codon:yes stop_codon:yes gene_type:complete
MLHSLIFKATVFATSIMLSSPALSFDEAPHSEAHASVLAQIEKTKREYTSLLLEGEKLKSMKASENTQRQREHLAKRIENTRNTLEDYVHIEYLF